MRCIYLLCLLPLLSQCFTITKVAIPPAPVVYGGSTKPVENFDPLTLLATLKEVFFLEKQS